jgi:hypothetical protein
MRTRSHSCQKIGPEVLTNRLTERTWDQRTQRKDDRDKGPSDQRTSKMSEKNGRGTPGKSTEHLFSGKIFNNI